MVRLGIYNSFCFMRQSKFALLLCLHLAGGLSMVWDLYWTRRRMYKCIAWTSSGQNRKVPTRLSVTQTDANMISLCTVAYLALFALAAEAASPKLEQCPGKSHKYNIFCAIFCYHNKNTVPNLHAALRKPTARPPFVCVWRKVVYCVCNWGETEIVALSSINNKIIVWIN